MTKSELITKLTAHMYHTSNISEKDIADTANEILELICQHLEKGSRVEIRGFGSFCLHHWGKRHARNPATGETWRTNPVHAVHFKPGKDLRERVNQRFLQGQNQTATNAVKRKERRVVEVETE